MNEISVYYKNNSDNIYLFDCNGIDSAIRAFDLEQYKKHKQNAYALVNGLELKLFQP